MAEGGVKASRSAEDDQTTLFRLDREFATNNMHLLAVAVEADNAPDNNNQTELPTAKQNNVEEQNKKSHDVETGDPYSEFFFGQKKREKEWKANRREAKKQKLDSSTPPGPSDAASDGHQDSVPELRKQLDEKTDECSRLKIKLESTEEVLKTQQHIQESFFQMLEKIQASVSGLGERVAAGFIKLEERLDLLESLPVNSHNMINATINSGCVNETVSDHPDLSEDDADLATIE